MDIKDLVHTRVNKVDLLKAPLLNNESLSQDIGRTLIVAPHPDDEALGCGGLISLLKEGAEVHVLFMTSGGASHPNSKKFSVSRLTSLREAEAINSCFSLGLTSHDITLMRLPDSQLHSLDSEEIARFRLQLDGLFSTYDFDSIVVPWRRDPHSDHRATYNLCTEYLSSIEKPVQCIEYPVWLWLNGETKDWPLYLEIEMFRLDVSKTLDQKIKAISAHQSQTTRMINDDPDGFILTTEMLAPFKLNYEYYFFTIPDKKCSLGNDYFKKIYEEEDPWNFKSSYYERQKYLKTLSYLKKYRFKNALEIGCSIGEHSNLLSRHCDRLMAVDISEDAINSAEKKFSYNDIITFATWNVTEGLPSGVFDLITLCEVGYYLSEADLKTLYANIDEKLEKNGCLLLVHWTSYVRDYPLTGTRVHQVFETLYKKEGKYKSIQKFVHPSYILDLWQKI